MAQETTYAGKLGGLTRLNTALAANASELTHLAGPVGRLDQILNEALVVANQQAALTASKQEATQRLQTLLADGERVAEGIRKFLKELYGLRSEKLAEFGIQPFRGKKRPADPLGPVPPEPPTTESAPLSISPDNPE